MRSAARALPFGSVDADLLVIPWFEEEGPAAVPGIDAASGGEVARALQSKEFVGRPYDIFSTGVTDPAWRVRRLVVAGAGKRSAFGTDIARKLAVAVGLWARQRRVARAAFVMRADATGGASTAHMAQAIAEGLTLAEFDGGSYKTESTTSRRRRRGPSWPRPARNRRRRRPRRPPEGGCSASAATSRASWPTSRATR